MDLADTFIHRNLHCVQGTVDIYSVIAFPGIRTHDLGLSNRNTANS